MREWFIRGRDFKFKDYENISEKPLISQKKLVPLQNNELADENKVVEEKPTVKKSTKKLTTKERKERAMNTRNNKLNKKC